MATHDPDIETISRSAYLGGRAIVTSALVVLYIFGAIELGNKAAAQFALAVGILILTNLTLLVAGQRSPSAFGKLLWVILPVDMTSIAIMAIALHLYEDPIYPIFAGMALAYSTMARSRYGWLWVSLVVSSFYITAHALAGDHTVGHLGFLLLNGGILVFFSYTVASELRRQVRRENEVRSAHDEVEELNRNMERRLTELQAVSEISEVIHSTLDFDSVGAVVIDIIQRVIDIPASSLFVIDKARAETLFSASRGTEAMYSPGAGVNQVLEGNDVHFTCMSVLDRDEVMVVFCAAAERLEAMRAEDRLVLQTIASELVVAVENSRLYKLTKRMAITDELTSLYNYRYLQQRLDEEVERARRYEKSLSLLMLDVDDFKHFNDTHGHIAGDRALSALGRVMRAAVREVDVVARYGGEEFSVLLPETDEPGAYVVAEKVREAISKHVFMEGDQEPNRLSVSIGLATLPGHASDKEGLLQQADEALYQAKNFGKNRVRTPQKSPSLDADGFAEEVV